MGRIVIVAYKPKPGKEDVLKQLSETHMQILKSQNLVTDRKPIIMVSQDGSIVEVFEWLSKQAIEAAHSNPTVQEMWGNFAQVCEYLPVANVPESTNLFSEFTPLN